MSTFTIATLLLANFGRQSKALSRPKAGPKSIALLTPTAPGTSTPALDRADAYGLTMIALTAAMLRFALADPNEEGFRRVPRIGVVAWPLVLAVGAFL